MLNYGSSAFQLSFEQCIWSREVYSYKPIKAASFLGYKAAFLITLLLFYRTRHMRKTEDGADMSAKRLKDVTR